MSKHVLSELLLQRKALTAKVKQLESIKAGQVFELQVKRIKVTDNIDEVTANVPKLTASQVTAEFDHYAKCLRMIDALIQRTNWSTEVEVDDRVMLSWDEMVAKITK